MNRLLYLDYAGHTAEQLLELEHTYCIDSIVHAFELGLYRKIDNQPSIPLNTEERTILAVEALEREVYNGGFDQFFINSSVEYTNEVVAALLRIGCAKAAAITHQAIMAIGVTETSAETIHKAMLAKNDQRDLILNRCDSEYCKDADDIATKLFAYIKANKQLICF